MNHRIPEARPQAFQTEEIHIELDVTGSSTYAKVSYPLKYGRFSRLTTPQAIFEFNLNHEIRHAQSRRRSWLHPQEWLKRTAGNDWVYYSTGGYSGVFEALGEYYLPNLTYPTNSLLGGKPFNEPEINHVATCWHSILDRLPAHQVPDRFYEWIEAIKKQTPEKLSRKADRLFDILGSRVSVLPPDARHVDYNIIPLNISEGCLYKCRFCKIKNQKSFTTHSQKKIHTSIQRLKSLYKDDIINYNALFLGDHDALNAPPDLILDTAETAHSRFGFSDSIMKGSFLFLFGSVDSFLTKQDCFFEKLNRLPYYTFINIGLESGDAKTLNRLGKPVTPGRVREAFEKIQCINTQYQDIEVTCNFVMDGTLDDAHYESLMDLVRHRAARPVPKGSIYMSPLAFGQPSRQVLYDFYKLKSKSRFPMFLYLIQRL